MKNSKTSTEENTLPAQKRDATTQGHEACLEVLIQCPQELNAVAREEWDRVVPFLAKTGALKPVDRGPLMVYCRAYADWLEAIQGIEQYGSIIKSPNGHPQQSPYVSIAKYNAELMIKIAQQFGFTPGSRGRTWMIAGTSTSDLVELDENGLAAL